MGSCGLGVIQWCLFDWQSFSTLATGFAAVAGAVIVGNRQAGITKLQTEILAKQVHLEEAKFRAELFQRRFETYEATADFLIHIAVLPEDDPEADERINRFNRKMRESEFLFSDPSVYPRLFEYWKRGSDARVNKAIVRAERSAAIPVGIQKLQSLTVDAMWGFSEAENLPALFRHDLTILRAN